MRNQDCVQDILLENVRIEIAKWSKWPGGKQDIRPCPDEGLPEHPYSGVFIQNARHVTLRNCEVAWSGALPEYYRHALESINLEGLTLENFSGSAARPDRYEAICQH